MKYYITIPYSKAFHLCLLTRTAIASKGRPDTLSFTFDSLTDLDSEFIIEHLKN